VDRLHAAVAAYLRDCGVPRAARVLVAVSGGADSMALLHALVNVGQRLAVAHVHHGLRGAEALADRAFVQDWAQRLGLTCHVADVAAGQRDGRSPEARARALRYAALEEIRAREALDYVATAHSLDDQAETVLLRAIRGTSPDGLAGISARLGERRLLRPLLAVERCVLRDYLVQRGLPWREDSSNLDLRIPRNRLRREVLPRLEEVHPGAARQLAALARAVQLQREAGAPELARALRDACHTGDGGVWIDADRLRCEPAPLRSALLADLLVRSGVGGRISRVHVERVAAFLDTARTGKQLSLPAGQTLLCDRGLFWLGPAAGPSFPGPFRVEIEAPAPIELPERGLRFAWSRSAGCAPSALALLLPAELPGPLVLRSPRVGDALCADSGRGPVRLKEVFASARWSRRERARAVVAELAGELVWVVGLVARPWRPGAPVGWHLVARPMLSAGGPGC